MKEQQIVNILPERIRKWMTQIELNYEILQEIRIRINQELTLEYDGQELTLREVGKIDRNKKNTQPIRIPFLKVEEKDIKEMIAYISQYSLYAYEQEVQQGYITIEGGHRVGFVGKAIIEQGKIKNIKYISSINIRVSHEKLDCSSRILPYLLDEQLGEWHHTLIISPPRCGKTTILRDIIRNISEGGARYCEEKYMSGRTVGVVDERSELAGCYHGIAQNQLGRRTDVLDACPKSLGMMLLVRSMSPQVIAVDEIGTKEDVQAVEYVMYCGCKIIASVHGRTLEEIKKKPVFQELLEKNIFERYVVLTNIPKVGSVRGIYDGNDNVLYQDYRE